MGQCCVKHTGFSFPDEDFAEIEGQVCHLRDGKCAYRFFGPPSGSLVIFIHGEFLIHLSTCSLCDIVIHGDVVDINSRVTFGVNLQEYRFLP